jgi:hypothetical protein
MKNNNKTQINWKQVNLMFEDLCTAGEVASALHITTDELNKAILKKFKIDTDTYAKQKQAETLHKMRLSQQKLSETNATMSIWLGKQYLGQRDRKEDDAVIPEKELLMHELKDFFE